MSFKFNTTTRVLTAFLAALTIPFQLIAAGPAVLDLRSTANFTILSGAAITSTGNGTIDGDVGASPIAGSAIGVTDAQVNGTIYAVDGSGPAGSVVDPARLSTAKGDLTTAFNDAAGRMPTPTGPNLNPGAGNLGGLNLAPGLYKITVTTLITGSDLTLTGGPDDVWIFQCAADLQLGSGIKVILAGGAQARNIFWQVGTSAVLGTFSVFKGTILASQSITMNTSSTMEGRALAFSGGVTYNGTSSVLPVNQIAVEQPVGSIIPDGGSKSFGAVPVGTNTSLTFTITNRGTVALTGLAITLDGTNAAQFSVISNAVAPVAPAGSTTFTVRFTPASAGVKTAALHIANNVTNSNPYDISISGVGTTVAFAVSSNVYVMGVPPPVAISSQSGLIEQRIRLTNDSAFTVTGLRVLILGLPADVTVYNASGTTNGTPFVQFGLPLAPGAVVDLTIEYYRRSRLAFAQPVYVVQNFGPVTVTETGPIMSILRDIQLTNGRFLIEFSAIPGRRYAVQYSSNMVNWVTAVPVVTAPANFVQWYDDGPPKTESVPLSVGSRFYRVMLLP